MIVGGGGAVLKVSCWFLYSFLLAIFFRPNDPFFLKGPFSWILFAPVIVALRYGFWYSLLAASTLVTLLILGVPMALIAQSQYLYYIFAAVVLAFLCGSFYDSWSFRLLRAQQLNAYAREHLDRLTRAYYTIKLSHDRLEQSVIVKPVTLRGVLEDLQKLLLSEGGKLTTDVGVRLLHLLEQYCYLNKAALYLVEKGQISQESIASLGGGRENIQPDDLLVQECLRNKNANYFTVEQLTEEQHSEYLVVAPMKTADKEIIAILTVKEMTFWALTEETLRGLTVLLAYFADQKWAENIAVNLLQKFSDCPLPFAVSIYQCQHLKQEHDLSSVLLCFVVSKSRPDYKQVIDSLEDKKRTLDFAWQYETERAYILFV